MRAGSVLAVSALAHCAVLAILARIVPVAAVARELPPVKREALIEVALIQPVEERNTPAGQVVDPRPSDGRARPPDGRVRAPDGSVHAPDGEVGATDHRGPAPDHRGPAPTDRDLMHPRPAAMRGGPTGLEGIAAGGRPPSPPVRESGRVESAPGGTGVVHDTVTTVSIERDGTAHFHDEPDVDIHLPPLVHAFGSMTELRHGLGAMIDRWYADPYAISRAGRFEDLPPDQKAVPGACDHWGECAMVEVDPPQGPLPAKVIAPVAGGKLDITGWLMRKTVGDPYASRKRALLDATIDERAARGGAFREELLARSAELMRKNLGQLWASERDPAARRLALFQMWDECAEGEGPLGVAGAQARAVVIGWIRAHLPEGYPPDELDTLNTHRQSTQRFEP